jgi:hypothetical protein
MPSQIDVTIPVTGNPTTASVRANFQTAADEISALQIATEGNPFLPLTGGTVTGSLYLTQDPTSGRQAVTKDYFDTHAAGGAGGVPEAPSDGTLYGRLNGAWSQAAALADITAGIAAAVVPSTETVSGILKIATTAQVSAGTDNTAAVTSAKLAASLTSRLGGYVPLAGSSTITGSLALAPTVANASATLTLNHPDTGGAGAIIAQLAGAETWRLTLGDTAHNNLIIARSVGPLAGTVMTFEQATGWASIGPGNFSTINFGMDAAPGTQAAAIIAGPVTPVSAAMDYFAIAQRRLTTPVSGSYRDGPLLVLRGGTATSNANGIELITGAQAGGYHTFTFDTGGIFTAPAQINTPAMAVTGSAGYPLNVTSGLGYFGAGVTIGGGNLTIPNGQFQGPWYSAGQIQIAASGGPIGWGQWLLWGGTNYIAYCDTTSDARIKQNIRDSDIDALAILEQLPIRAFEFRAEITAHSAAIHLVEDSPERQAIVEANMIPFPVSIGLVADEVETLIPEAVGRALAPPANRDPKAPPSPFPDDVKHLNDRIFTPYVIRAIQQLAGRVAALEGGSRHK